MKKARLEDAKIAFCREIERIRYGMHKLTDWPKSNQNFRDILVTRNVEANEILHEIFRVERISLSLLPVHFLL